MLQFYSLTTISSFVNVKKRPSATNVDRKHSMVLTWFMLQCQMLRISTCIEIVLVFPNHVFVLFHVAATLFIGFYHRCGLMLFTCGGYINFVDLKETIGSTSTWLRLGKKTIHSDLAFTGVLATYGGSMCTRYCVLFEVCLIFSTLFWSTKTW